MTTQTVEISRSISMVIGNPTIESGAVAVTTGFVTLLATPTGGGYVYIRNTEPTTAATVEIQYGAQSLGLLRPGEWAFLPIPEVSANLNLKGSLATTAEWAYWTTA